MKRQFIVGWMAVLGAVIFAQSANAATKTTFERWYVVSLQGQPAGYAVERELTADDGRITSTMQIQISVGRGGLDLQVQMGTEFVETADGKPISAKTTQMLAAAQSVTDVRFTDKGLLVTTTENGRTTTQTQPLPEGEWLTPSAAFRYMAKQMAAGEKTIRYRSFDPSTSLKPFSVTVQVLGNENVEVAGKLSPATKMQVETSLMSGVQSTEFVDEQGHTLRNSVSIGFMTMEMMAADKALAMTERKGPELLSDTLIHPAQPVANPRKLDKATWVLTMKKGKLPDLPTTPAQSVKRIDARSAEVTIDMNTAVGDANAAAPAVENTSMADGRDPRIIALKDEALKNLPAAATAAQKAETIRKFVHSYIHEKSLDVGMASAGEVAQTRTGDCTEHAVLLAAMLRAANIPSRTVTGLIYVSSSAILDPQAVGPTGIFGYHMWAEAWLDGQWTDLDAVLGDDESFDATHIALAVSTMPDGQWVNDLVTFAPVLGQLQIAPAPGPRK